MNIQFSFNHLCRFLSVFIIWISLCDSSTLPSPIWDQPFSHQPKGALHAFRFSSRKLKNTREIWMYTPPSFQKTDDYPLLIVFDGQAYTSQLIPGTVILDNLIAANKIPPLIAVFVSSLDQKRRNLELPCYDLMVECLVQELLPWIHRHYPVSHDPAHIIVAGSSYGGLAAAYAAFRYPQNFGNVLSQSGAFWWAKNGNSSGWLIDQFEKTPPLPIRFYLDVGDQETDSDGGRMSMVEINRKLAAILKKKGNEVTFYEFNGGHEYECWRQTFATGLIALFARRT